MPLPDHGFEYRTIGPDLYEGTAGVALFLAYLARATGRSDFAELALAAYTGAARRFLAPNGDRSLGAFTGAPGLLYTALHLAAVLDEPALVTDALGLLAPISRQVAKDRTFDVLSGSAGGILVLLRVAERHPSSAALRVATACGRHLVRHGVAVDGGLGWPPGPDGGRPLLGPGPRGRRDRRRPGPARPRRAGSEVRSHRQAGARLRTGPLRRRGGQLARSAGRRRHRAPAGALRVGVVPRGARHRHGAPHDAARRPARAT